jgi:predicted kinase
MLIIKSKKSAVILIGLQASGKSAFCRENFALTHAYISLDELRTRSRESVRLEECISDGRPFVVDNTNAAAKDRERYIKPAKEAGYHIIGVFFRNALKECLARNRARAGARVPDIAVIATAKKIEPPVFSEGFDEIYYVSIEDGGFRVKKCNE